MDDSQGLLVTIATVMIVLVVLAAAILILMLIYRKQKLQRDHELARARLEVQQKTVQYIGSEIHDFVGNRLGLVMLYLNSLRADQEEIKRQIKAAIQEALTTVRSISKLNINTTDGSLEDLIRNETERLRGIGQLNVSFKSSLDKIQCRNSVTNFSLMRIVQEFLHNSISHSACTEISIAIAEHADHIELSVKDNGVGFDIDAAKSDPGKGVGLRTMQHRAEEIGATFKLTSEAGKGTSMTMMIPERQLKI